MDSYIARHWDTLCISARTSGTQLGQGLSKRAANLMRQEVARFCDSPAPASREQLNSAYTRRMALSARLTAIARAEAMASAHPEMADSIFAEVGQFCDGDLADDGESFLELQQKNLELTNSISEMCYQEATKAGDR